MHIPFLHYNIKLMASLSQVDTQNLLEDTVAMQQLSDCRAEPSATLQLLLLKYYAWN